MKNLDCDDDPIWILGPPDDYAILPPVETRDQVLPFDKLTWQNFERLCLKLAGTDGDAEHWRLYGTEGQEQGGIDIYVRRKSTAKYAVWQSKREKAFGPASLQSAVDKFISGDWREKSDLFVLCVQASLRSTETVNKIEECAAKLRKMDIEFQPKDSEGLSLELKVLPEIVDDFFGRAWVTQFCGQEAADNLSHRLPPKELVKLRAGLRECYSLYFNSVDPGVLSQMSISNFGKRHFPLSERFVPPDLRLENGIMISQPPPTQKSLSPIDPQKLSMTLLPELSRYAEPQFLQEKVETTLENWLNDINCDVVLGAAGTGKSTLLRFLALDMLSENPRFTALRRRFPDYLPIWVSFAFWTKLIATDQKHGSLIDAIERWFRLQDEPDLVALVRKALEDKRLLLLIDGIDEWENETVANTALTLLQTFAKRRSIPIILTSRPHGFRLMNRLDNSWRISEIAPLTVDQQIDLASKWFMYLNPTEIDSARNVAKSREQASNFVAELKRNGPIAQLAATPLLLTGLIALRRSQRQLPRNRFLAYKELTKLLLEVHPAARDKAALASGPRHSLDVPTRETALSALAFAIHSGNEGSSPDSIEVDQAISVVSQCLTQRIGMLQGEAQQEARKFLSLGEEEIGILVKKSPREVGFFHRVFQEFLAARHIASLSFDKQIELVQDRATDARWSDVILCLLHQLDRPDEVDRLLAAIETVQGDALTISLRDLILAEATFGEVKKSPKLALQLADNAFQQIEVGRWSTVRQALTTHAIEGLSSPVLGLKVSQRLSQWFPRWHSYGLERVFQTIANWPDDTAEDIKPFLWRGLHDEFPGVARAAAKTFAKRFGGQLKPGERLCQLIAAPASVSAAAAGIEALSNGWPGLSKTNDILIAARHSGSPLLAITAIRGRISLGKQDDDDFSFLTQLGEEVGYHDDFLINHTLLIGWAGDDRLRRYALHKTPGEFRQLLRRPIPDFLIAINGFPGDPQVADLIAQDFRNNNPMIFLEREIFNSLALHFKGNPTVVAALESWVLEHRPDDAYTISLAARVASTPKLKSALLKCLESEHSLKFWAASALVDLWGADDDEVHSALIKCSKMPVEIRQDIAHVLPLVMSKKDRCRNLLLEIIASREKNIRADFALQGLRHLGVDASDRDATNIVLARGYDEERFTLENEVREVILTFKDDERVFALAKRQLQREFGPIDMVAQVYSESAEMRSLVLNVVAPLDLKLRSTLLNQLSMRAGYDSSSRSLIVAALLENEKNINVGASIALARVNKQENLVTMEFVAEIQRELNAVGPRLAARRQSALASLIVIGRLDLFKKPEHPSSFDGLGFDASHEILHLTATEWASIVHYFDGNEAALAALGVDRRYFFDVFGNYLDASNEIKAFALHLIDQDREQGAPAAAIRLIDRVHPRSGYLRELCLKSLNYNGRHPWESFSSAMTAAEVLGSNFRADKEIEAILFRNLDVNPTDF